MEYILLTTYARSANLSTVDPVLTTILPIVYLDGLNGSCFSEVHLPPVAGISKRVGTGPVGGLAYL